MALNQWVSECLILLDGISDKLKSIIFLMLLNYFFFNVFFSGLLNLYLCFFRGNYLVIRLCRDSTSLSFFLSLWLDRFNLFFYFLICSFD